MLIKLNTRRFPLSRLTNDISARRGCLVAIGARSNLKILKKVRGSRENDMRRCKKGLKEEETRVSESERE